jgi:hypothetical protein
MEEEIPIELDPPDGVEQAETAVEVMRAWIGDGALLVSLNSTAFGGRVEDWGRLLAEIAHHVANAAALNGYMAEDEAKTVLREAFLSGLEQAAPDMSGKLKGQIKH